MDVSLQAMWDGSSRAARATRVLLSPLSAVFSMAARSRGALYDAGMLRVERVSIPVLCVGNLRVGGSGKTPTVLWLVERLRRIGVRPVVAMRGYGSRRGSPPTWLEPIECGAGARTERVADLGFRVVSVVDAVHDHDVSDEASLIALRGAVAVVSHPDRVRAGQAAVAAGADVLVLDDGFQHRRLHRDVDLVLVERSEGNERLLPAGPLREPWEALQRADVVLMPDIVPVPGAAVVARIRVTPVGWVDRVSAAATVAPLDARRGSEVVAVAAIARPQRFFDMLDEWGVRIRERRVFPDHHRYTHGDWLDIRRAARAGEWIATTEKDLVKLHALADEDARLTALRIEVNVEPERDVLRRIRAAVGRLDASEGGPHDLQRLPAAVE